MSEISRISPRREEKKYSFLGESTLKPKEIKLTLYFQSIMNIITYYDEATKILHSAAYEMNTITAALSGGKFGLQSSRMTCARLTAKLCENYGLLHYEKDKTCIQANLRMLGKGTRKSKPLVRKNGLT